MRVTYNRETDAAYISLTDATLMPGRKTLFCGAPTDLGPVWVMADWKDGRLVGLEVLDASHILQPDLLEQAGAQRLG